MILVTLLSIFSFLTSDLPNPSNLLGTNRVRAGGNTNKNIGVILNIRGDVLSRY